MQGNGEEHAGGRRCGTCGAALAVFPCRACRARLRRRRLFHVIDSTAEGPPRSELEPAEAERLLDTLLDPTLMANRGRKRPDKPRPRLFHSRAFRFQLGTIGPVFYMRLHPQITVDS